jgi:hypothetical protein
VLLQKLIELFKRKLVQADDPRLRTRTWRQRVPRFDLAVDFDDDPSAMIAVAATEVGVRQEMGAGLQKKPNRTRARDLLGLVRNLDEKPWHGQPFLSDGRGVDGLASQ